MQAKPFGLEYRASGNEKKEEGRSSVVKFLLFGRGAWDKEAHKGFWVLGSGFRVLGPGCKVQGSGCWVQGSGCYPS